MGPNLTTILKKQFEIAGHLDKFDSIDFKNSTWYSDYTWTKEQEKEFKNWIIKYLQDNLAARKEIMKFPSRTKKTLEKWFYWWNLSYGFRIENNETE